jgi:hypothetical protein
MSSNMYVSRKMAARLTFVVCITPIHGVLVGNGGCFTVTETHDAFKVDESLSQVSLHRYVGGDEWGYLREHPDLPDVMKASDSKLADNHRFTTIAQSWWGVSAAKAILLYPMARAFIYDQRALLSFGQGKQDEMRLSELMQCYLPYENQGEFVRVLSWADLM